MKKIIYTLLLVLLSGSLSAQKIPGTWYGTLTVPGMKLPVVFHIIHTGEVYSTTMDSPVQKASGIPTTSTTVTANQLIIEATAMKMKYTGTYLPDSNKINGNFIQNGMSFPLVLTPVKPDDAVVKPVIRPQDPTSFPYKREELIFTNVKAGNQLAGTLTMPASGKITKIVVLITGSGPQNRDEEITQFNHRPFLVWSDWLTRNGIAVLRYDDRGVGKSTGDFNTATTADFADDAEAAVSYIESRTDLKKLSIGLIGHSEGGLIAPIVASRNKAVKFVVLLAGPGIPVTELMVQQNKDQLRLAGTSAANTSLLLDANVKLFAMVNANKDLPVTELRLKLDTMLRKEYSTFPQEVLNGQTIDELVSAAISQSTTPWFRYFIGIHPADALTKVKCPVLALNGTLDMQVSISNLDAIKTALKKAGNIKFTIEPLNGLNHLFQHATTGAVSEYSQNSETVNPIALQRVSLWINGL